MTKAKIQAELAAIEKLWDAVKADAADGTISERDGAAVKLLQARMCLPTTLMPYRTAGMTAAKEFHSIVPVGDGRSEAPDEANVHPDSLLAYRRLHGVYDSIKKTLEAAYARK